MIAWWIIFSIKYPWFGLPANAAIFYFFFWAKSSQQESTVVVRTPSAPPNWELLRQHDANFSEVLFRDFGYSLFAKIHEARGSGQLDRYSQYLNDNAKRNLEMLHSVLTDVLGVVVGGLTVRDLSVPDVPEGKCPCSWCMRLITLK